MSGHRTAKFVALAVCLALVWLPANSQQGQPSQSLAGAPPRLGDPKKALAAFRLAQEAEGRGDWQRAFEQYSQATQEALLNGSYLMRREAARFQLVQAHMDRAERAAIAGHLDEARLYLAAALQLDPAYTVAQERLQHLRPRGQAGSESTSQLVEAPVELAPQAGTRSFDYRGDTRGAFEEVARQFGVTAAFDADLRPKQVRFRVSDVDFQTAMRILAQQTDTFWFATDRRAFFVADDTPAKRRDVEPSVVRTVALSGLTTPDQMTEITRLVRDISGLTRTQLDSRLRTLTLRGSPRAVTLAARLVAELEQAVGELMLEIDILEVDRDTARRLGVTPPSSARTFTISPLDVQEAQQSPEALLRVLQRIFGSAGALSVLPSGGGLAGLIPPLIAIGGGRTIVLATLPGATAEFLDAYSVLRRGRRMLLRAQDGQQATFFIGERFPIALATLQPNLVVPLATGVGGSPFPRTDLTAGDGPHAVATADLNGDGRSDLVVANMNDNSVSIFLADSTGVFSSRTDVGLGNTPTAVALADFNADGRPDIAVTIDVANQANDLVTILLNNGDGTFGTRSDFTVGTTPSGVVAGDFNSDGRQDLAIANHDSDSVTVLLGDGAGGFPTTITLNNVGQGPSAITAGNVNAGSVLDLVVVNDNSDTAAILLGNGDGTFNFTAEGSTGDSPSAVLLADFTGDSVLDLAITNRESDTVLVLIGNGDGTFSGGTEFVTGDGPAGLAAGDLNVDGLQDLAVVNENADSVSILLGTGGGAFGVRADFATGDAPTSVVAVDFNGDGRRDLALTNRDGDTVSIVLNQVVLMPPGSPFTTNLQAPYPGFQYEDLGLKVRATPRLHPDREVTLQLQIEVRSRTGQTINGIPVISNRALEQTVRLRENERTLLTGIIQREERKGISGWPGLASVPAVGHVAGSRDRSERETELLIVITPRRIRLADRAGSLLYVGREPGGAAGGANPP